MCDAFSYHSQSLTGTINIGKYCSVTEEGKKTIESQILKMGNGDFVKGLDQSEPFLVQELVDKDKSLGDKQKEYLILGGSHQFHVFQQQYVEKHVTHVNDNYYSGVQTWPCLILHSSLARQIMTEEEREILVGANNAKSQEGTAKASWFEYFEKLVCYLELPNIYVKKSGKFTVDWDRVHQLSVCVDKFRVEF